MRRLPLIIDGVDFSASINRYGYTVGYIKREGGFGGMMQDGSMRVDILARKAVLTLTANSLKSDAQAALLSACAKDYVTVTYFDTMSNRTREAEFIPDIGDQTVGILSADGTNWFTGMIITLTER